MTRKIVSANYNDRESPYRWLVRDEGQHPSEAVAFMSVVLTNAIFCPSSDHESGFGCSIVAFCDEAIGSNNDVSPDTKKLSITILNFSGTVFYDPETDQNVPSCKTLVLNTDGSMQAEV